VGQQMRLAAFLGLNDMPMRTHCLSDLGIHIAAGAIAQVLGAIRD